MGLDLGKAAMEAKAERDGAPGTKIEITEEMIEAGASVLVLKLSCEWSYSQAHDLAREILECALKAFSK